MLFSFFGQLGGVADVGRDLAGFHKLFEAPQVAAELNLGFALQDFGSNAAKETGWWIIGHQDGNYRPATALRRRKSDATFIEDISIIVASPGNECAVDIFGDTGAPSHLRSARAVRNPVGGFVIDYGDRLDVIHDLRKVRKITPKPIEIGSLAIDCYSARKAFKIAVIAVFGSRRRGIVGAKIIFPRHVQLLYFLVSERGDGNDVPDEIACATFRLSPPSSGTFTRCRRCAAMESNDCDMQNLAEQAACLLKAAKQNRLQLVTVESCTGGLLASMLTDIEGLSHVFNRALVTYCDPAKVELAAVPETLLQEHGAVSEAVAQAMACGGRLSVKDEDCLAVAITGYAGPGDDGDQPGLVYIAASTPSAIRVERHNFASDDRDLVRYRAVEAALSLGLKILR
jgi:nicotinamide-nucleotide amidase